MQQTLIVRSSSCRQDKALAEMDKEAESNESDSEEVDKDRALAEKENVTKFLRVTHRQKERGRGD